MQTKPKIVFDLDGTLYNTLDINIFVENQVRRRMGMLPITNDFYVMHFQTRDWRRLGLDFGYPEEMVDHATRLFFELHSKAPLPEIIPGAHYALKTALGMVGEENVHVVTNESKERVSMRFERDGLVRILPRVITPHADKSSALYSLSQETSGRVVYLGDIVSDGEAVMQARSTGAENLFFYGLTHAYSFNHPDSMRNFISSHSNFSEELTDLRDVKRVLC